MKYLRRSFLLAVFAFFIARSIGCQYDLTGNPDVNLLTVHAYPDSSAVPVNGAITLTASITGFNTDTSITWVIEAPAGTSYGTLDPQIGNTVVYHATNLNVFHLPPLVHIRAVPTEDPTRYAVCTIYIQGTDELPPNDTAFAISPSFVRVQTNHPVQFTLDTMTQSLPLGAVQWSITRGPGTISDNGFYTPPASIPSDTNIFVNIKAVSTSDKTVFATAAMQLISEGDSLLCFSRDVLTTLSGSCGTSGCHDAASHQSGYDFNTYSGSTKDVHPGDARASRIFHAIIQPEASERMPPPPSPALTPQQVYLIGRWINEGARDCQ